MKAFHFLHDRALALLLLVALFAAIGGVLATAMPLAIFPSVTFPLVKVIADVGHEPAARMMPRVTRPLEQALLPLPGIRLVRSTTSRGSTELTATFDWSMDMQVALQRVQQAVDRLGPDLPPETHIDIAPMNTALFPILGYALTSETRSQADLWELAEYTLRPELVRIEGVSQVQIQGGRQREFQVHLDPAALASRHLSVTDVLGVLRQNNQVLSGGLVEANHELYLSLVDGVVGDKESLARVAIPVPGNGVPALLGELGTVTVADAPSYIRTTANGRPAVLINLTRDPAANTVAIAESVRRMFAERPDLVPKDVQWTTFYDQAEYISHSVNGVRDAILIGVGLAALVLLVFLRNVRLTLAAIVSLPVTVAIVLFLLSVTGQTINLMTLGGIAAALGLIADDAIVVAESIQHHRETGSPNPAVAGQRAILYPLIGSSLSTIVIFLPFALLTGVVGAFFRPLALTMGLALAVSFFLSITCIPVGLRVLGGALPRARPPAREHRGTHFLVRHAWISALLCAGLLASAWFLYTSLGSDFLPAMDEGSIILDYWTPPGTSLTDTDTMLNGFEKALMKVPDVRDYSRRTGTQLGFFITEPNRGDYVIRLKPRRERRDVDEVIADIRARAAAIAPAVHTDFGQLLEDNIGDLTGGAPQPIDIRLFSQDQRLLQEGARAAAGILAGVRGIEDVFDGIVIAGPALTVRVPPDDGPHPAEAARTVARYGLTTESVQAAIEPAVEGTVAGNIRIGERLYGLRVLSRPPGGLSTLRIRTPSGAIVNLSDVASISTGAPEAEIDRENLKTFLAVTARLEGRDLGSTIAEIRAKLNRDLPKLGLQIAFGGLYEQQQSSFRQLFLVLVGGLVLVAIVVLFEFGDWRAPILTALCGLAVLAGVFGALVLTGMTLNISSYVGAIMMVGIVGENAIFVIHEAREALRSGSNATEAWAHAALRRRRPVIMTILASACALAPLALARGEGSQLQQPLAIAVIGGFVLSGFLVLVVLPALYRALDPYGRLGRRSM